MKILITTSTFPARIGDGVPRFVLDLARALSKSEAVEVLAPDAPDADRADTWDDVAIHRFTYFRPRRLQCLAPGIRDSMRGSWLGKLQVIPFVLTSLLSMRKHVLQVKPDVVNAHWLIPQGLIAALLKTWKMTFVLVLHVHAGDVDLLSTIPLGNKIARFIVGRSDVVFTAGKHVTKRLDNLIAAESKAISRPMGVDLGLFASKGRRAVTYRDFRAGYILFVGRLVEKKGVRVLLDAMPRVLEENPGTGLIIIGEGPLTSSLKAHSEALGIAQQVLFVGAQAHETIADHLVSCRVAAIPSVIDQHNETEGTPTVLVEAMAAGAAVVASEVAGIPEMICDGVNGWLCRPNDPEDLARAIRVALSHHRLPDVKDRARVDAAAFSWEKVAADYLAAIAEVRQADRSTSP